MNFGILSVFYSNLVTFDKFILKRKAALRTCGYRFTGYDCDRSVHIIFHAVYIQRHILLVLNLSVSILSSVA